VQPDSVGGTGALYVGHDVHPSTTIIEGDVSDPKAKGSCSTYQFSHVRSA